MNSTRSLASSFRRHAVRNFLGALLLMLTVLPFLEALPNGRHLEGLLLTALLLTGMLAVSGERQSLALAAGLAAPMLFAFWFQLHRQEGLLYQVFIGYFLACVILVIVRILGFIRRATQVDSEVLCAGIAVYLLLGLLWAVGYALTARMVPGAFTGVSAGEPRLQGFDALYFSFITLTTVGYGDIAPVARPARMLAMMETVTGTLYLAVLISRLVSMHASTPPPTPPGVDSAGA